MLKISLEALIWEHANKSKMFSAGFKMANTHKQGTQIRER